VPGKSSCFCRLYWGRASLPRLSRSFSLSPVHDTKSSLFFVVPCRALSRRLLASTISSAYDLRLRSASAALFSCSQIVRSLSQSLRSSSCCRRSSSCRFFSSSSRRRASATRRKSSRICCVFSSTGRVIDSCTFTLCRRAFSAARNFAF